jgi:putative endonuclease
MGRRAELAAADYLVALGFVILERNARLGPLELDLVARRQSLVVVTEVRTRSDRSFERAFESISPAKRARVVRAVDRLWRDRLAADPSIERIRIDAAAVTFDRGQTSIEYIEGAF